MGSQFHTPSFGDEIFDLSGMDDSVPAANVQQDCFGSRRLQNVDNVVTNVGCNGLQNNFAVETAQPIQTSRTHAAHKPTNDSNDSNQKGEIEPTKPLSAFSYFFRDTVSTIKEQNPDCCFDQLAVIVSSMWNVLDPAQKEVFVKKADEARAEYLKQMRLYQLNLEVQQKQQQLEKEQQKQQQTATNVDTTVKAFNNSLQQSEAVSSIGNAAIVNQNAIINQTQSQSPLVNPIPQQNNEQELCIREGCNRLAVMNPDWEDEYCSNECVVIHCRNVFNAWVLQNKQATIQ